MQSDILVRDAAGEIVLAVEVKARRGVDEGWAAQLRRNLHAHGVAPRARFFMIVTADKTYLWRDREDPLIGSDLPDAVAATSELIGGELIGRGPLDGRALELLTSSWLTALTAVDDPVQLRETSRPFLVDTGLFDALRDAAVAFEVA